MSLGRRAGWSFALSAITTAVCAIAGGSLAAALGPSAALGWYAVLFASFIFTAVAIILSDALARAVSNADAAFGRSLETLTLAAGVLAPLGTHFVSFWLAPHQSENISIVAAYFASKDANGGHDAYLNVIAWTCMVALLVGVIAVVLARAGNDLWARNARLTNECLAIVVLLVSSLLLLPWVSVEPASVHSASALGQLILNQILFVTTTAGLVIWILTILRTLPAALRAARAAALSITDIAMRVAAGLVVSFVILALLAALLWLLSSVVPAIGSASRVSLSAIAAFATAARPVLVGALLTLSVILGIVFVFGVGLWIVKRAVRFRLTRGQVWFGLSVLVIALLAIAFTSVWRLFATPVAPPTPPQLAFRETEVACLGAAWMVRQTDRATVPVDRCFPLEDADYVVAIGDATQRGRRSTEEARAFERARRLAEAVESRYPALSGHIFALNAGVTSESSDQFEANKIRAIVARVSPEGGRVSDAEFISRFRDYLRANWIGPHSVCRVYRLNSASAAERLTEIDNISCKSTP